MLVNDRSITVHGQWIENGIYFLLDDDASVGESELKHASPMSCQTPQRALSATFPLSLRERAGVREALFNARH